MKMKRILAAVMAVAMLVPCLMAGASAAETPVTRAAAVQQLAQVLGADTSATTTRYTDVPANASYAGAVAWATANGVVTGKTETKFDPNGSLTVLEAATLIARAAEAEGVALTGGVLTYANAASIADWAQEHVAKCSAAGILARFVDANNNIDLYQTVSADDFARMINGVSGLVSTRNALVDVAEGRYMGTKENGVYRFVGIQYGVAERFQAATPASAFRGIHTATTYGNASPTDNQAAHPGATDTLVTSYMTPNAYWAENENCLFLNVWSTTLNDQLTGETTDATRPVLFFIHGGGLTNGSGNELTYYDGANFARETGAVYVSVNHRLNILGYSNLTAYNEQYGKNYETNLGQKDLVLALQWVRDNIAQFGGDPNNVTIIGQSGGGSKVSGLMGSPAALEVFDKAIFCSGGPSSFTATQESTQQSGKDWVAAVKEQKGVETDEEALALLETMPYDELYAVTGGKYPGIVIDDFMTESCYNSADGTWGNLSKDVPVMISATFAEMAGSMANNCLPALINNTTDFGIFGDPAIKDEWVMRNNNDYMTEEYLMSELTKKYGEGTDAIIEAFLETFPHLNVYDLRNYNGRSDNAAMARVNSGADKTYVAFYAYKFPIFGGTMAWHTGGDLPFIFQNVDKIAHMVAGDVAGAQRLADAASGAVYNFMKTGDPSTDALTWDAFTAEDGAVMVFDGDSTLRTGFFSKQLEDLRATYNQGGGGFPF